MNDSNRNSTIVTSEITSPPATEIAGVLGIDVGDRFSRFCLLDATTGAVARKGRMPTTVIGLNRLLAGKARLRVAIEVGTHSAWMSRHIEELGHEALVANSRKLRAIYKSDRKNDELDALMLARLARVGPELLCPIQHRSAEAQTDLAALRARDELVRCRTKLINSVRGTVKSFGERLPSCSAEAFHKAACVSMPNYLQPALLPLVAQNQELTARIRDYDKLIVRIAKRYPVVERLQEIPGVGPITALTYILTLEDPKRFKSARSAGAYVGLCPKLDESGDQSS